MPHASHLASPFPPAPVFAMPIARSETRARRVITVIMSLGLAFAIGAIGMLGARGQLSGSNAQRLMAAQQRVDPEDANDAPWTPIPDSEPRWKPEGIAPKQIAATTLPMTAPQDGLPGLLSPIRFPEPAPVVATTNKSNNTRKHN